jgi:HK97 family phage major capsid protein
MSELETLKGQLQEAVSEIKSGVAARDAEVKSYGEVTEATAKKLNEATERLDSIKSDFDGVNERLEKMELDRQKLYAGEQAAKSYGEQFVSSDVFADMQKAGRANGVGYRVEKSITGGAGSAGALVRPDRRPDVIVTPDRPSYIRDLLPAIPTSSNAVEVMRQNVYTTNAAPQAGEFAAKAESNITYELITVPIRTMAHFVPASRQVLSDAAVLQGLINSRLMYGLNLLADEQLLYGDGSGQNLTGLMVDAGVSDIGGLAVGTAAKDVPGAMLDHIRKAITECQKNDFYNINGVVLNPQDWQELELAKGTDGHYIWVTVPNGGEPRLWRVPVIVSNAMAAGQFLLGDWTLGATIYDREQMDIRVSESHSDFFVKNGVAILAEERYGFGIELPKAYTKGSFDVTTT